MESSPANQPAPRAAQVSPTDPLQLASKEKTSPFDFIIVGAGAGGGPLACRLAEAGHKVLLIEAGPDPKDAGVVHDAPLFHGAATEDPALSWSFSVRHFADDNRQKNDHKYDSTQDPAAGASGKGGIFYPRSTGLGGCTGHHAMIVIRPNDRDWEQIAELTNDESWRAKYMQPYFARFERCLYLDEYRGFLVKLFGLFSRAAFAFMAFINPRSALDRGGHGDKGWQPTSFIAPRLIQSILKTDALFAKVLIQSAFKVIEGNSRFTAFLKRLLIMFGFVRSFDPNDRGSRADSAEGVFLIPAGIGGANIQDENGNSLRGRRAGVREFILNTRAAHPDRLVIAKCFHVTRVLFDHATPPRAIGVEGAQGEYLYAACAREKRRAASEDRRSYFVRHEASTDEKWQAVGEVILCGGSFNTPQLLLLSGVGDFRHINEINQRARANEPKITPRVNLPGVGTNLQDRYEVGVVSEMQTDFKSLETLSFNPASNDDKLLQQWKETRDGLYATNGGTVAIVQRSSAADGPEPDLFTFGAPAAFRGYYWNWSRELLRPLKGAAVDQTNLWTWVILKAYTRNNRGRVRLTSTDPFATPDICFHSFDDATPGSPPPNGWERDVAALVDAVKKVREISAASETPFLHELQPEGYLKRCNAMRAANNLQPWSLEDWIQNEAWGHHACGTCRIGSDRWTAATEQLTDKMAVLDSRFKVHGVQGLRVVDASVFPKIPGYFILAPIFMVSEKAADTILKDSGEEQYPQAVREFEENAVRDRRRAAWLDAKNQLIEAKDRPLPPSSSPLKTDPAPPSPVLHAPLENCVGLALSGGGIRSATFSLGVLQALATRHRLRYVDYLSTISGGGFTGSFLGRLFTRPGICGCVDPAGRAEELLQDPRSGPLAWLRRQANYLMASGTDDFLTSLGVFFRGVFSVHLFVGTLLLFIFGAVVGFGEFLSAHDWLPLPPGPPRWFGFIPTKWWWLPVAALGLVVVPLKLAYWLAPKKYSYRAFPPHEFAAWLIVVTGVALAAALPEVGLWPRYVLGVLGATLVWLEAARGRLPATTAARRLDGVVVRNRLTRGLGDSLLIFLGLILWAIVDSVARTVATQDRLTEMVGALLALAPGLRLLRSWAAKVAPVADGRRTFTLLKITAVGLALALLFIVDVIAHSLFLVGQPAAAWCVVVVSLLVSSFMGRAFDFLNLTSLQSAYAARITRTFLGASNNARTVASDNIAADVQVAHPDDDLPHHEYRPERSGGPLHLIGVCINESVDHTSQREIRERKGLLMTVGSFGVSVGRRFFARWSSHTKMPRWLRFRRWFEGINGGQSAPTSLQAILSNADGNTFHPLARRDKQAAAAASLSLGEWVAISGAAFSTGRGRASNPFEALFMGLCNFRLGYWWDSGIGATERPGSYPPNVWRRLKELPGELFATHNLLLSEWRARFDGPSREFWNLTDGGHLDNSAAYELVRRQLPFIILVDATSDPDYSFEALATLERDVRIDFGAEINWKPYQDPPDWISQWLNPVALGRLAQLRGNPASGGPGQCRGVLALITYPPVGNSEAKKSWLLLIKSGLVGNESGDVTQYARSHPSFPQESTTDQFFDDEQWESYRRLGYQAGLDLLK